MTDSATKTEAIQKPKRTDFETKIIAIQKPQSMIQKPKCTIQNHNLRFRNRNLAATPSDHYVASWTSQEIKTPPRPPTTMLHVELHKRSKPRHALWPLCCMLNFTRDQYPATPFDHYVEFWTSQEIKAPPRPLTIMLHVELHKRSTPCHALWPLCCMLNFTRDQYPAAPSDHYVACWTSQKIKTPPPTLTTMLTMLHLELHKRSKPRHALWPLCCMLNFTRDQSPATPSDHYVACWTSQEIKAPPCPLTTMLHVELHKRSKPRHPLWSLCPWRPADCTVQNSEQTHPLCSTHWSSQIDG